MKSYNAERRFRKAIVFVTAAVRFSYGARKTAALAKIGLELQDALVALTVSKSKLSATESKDGSKDGIAISSSRRQSSFKTPRRLSKDLSGGEKSAAFPLNCGEEKKDENDPKYMSRSKIFDASLDLDY